MLLFKVQFILRLTIFFLKDIEYLRITGTCFLEESSKCMRPLLSPGKLWCLFFKLNSVTLGYNRPESFRRSLKRHVFFLLFNLFLLFPHVDDRKTTRKYIVNINLNKRITAFSENTCLFLQNPKCSVDLQIISHCS